MSSNERDIDKLMQQIEAMNKSWRVFRISDCLLFIAFVGFLSFSLLDQQSNGGVIGCNAVVTIWIAARLEQLRRKFDLVESIMVHLFMEQGSQNEKDTMTS
ncbi:MAG: hypothetical protein ACJ8C4_07245 [Gemmataceae bacterium]